MEKEVGKTSAAVLCKLERMQNIFIMTYSLFDDMRSK